MSLLRTLFFVQELSRKFKVVKRESYHAFSPCINQNQQFHAFQMYDFAENCLLNPNLKCQDQSVNIHESVKDKNFDKSALS